MSTTAASQMTDGTTDPVDHRERAGRILLSEVTHAGVRPSVIGAITPTAIPVAQPMAERFGVPLALVLARTLAVPHCPTGPFGALDEDGHYVLDYAAVAGLRLDTAEILAARELVLPELTLARTLYGGPALSRFLPAAVVLLVQGAMEHGLLMEAAVEQALRRGAEEVVVATAWASPWAAARFRARGGVRFICPWIGDGPHPATIPTEEDRPHPQPEVATWLASQPTASCTPRRRASDRAAETP
jgi:predicted phosphoribosyltransferase